MKEAVSALSASQSGCLPAQSGLVCPVPTLSEKYFDHNGCCTMFTMDRPTQATTGHKSEGYLPDGGDHIFVFLSAQKLLDAEVELLQQLFIRGQSE